MNAHGMVMKKRIIQHHENAKDKHPSINREDWFWCVAAQCKVRVVCSMHIYKRVLTEPY